MSIPFSAGRARNAGFERLCGLRPEIEFVQFIDGDCSLDTEWPGAARNFLVEHTDVAIVCGRRREMYPEATLYNQLCELEWNTPVGYAQSCGGDFLVRRSAFDQVGGFDGRLIAGEEPELCHRLRLQGLKIYRLDRPMSLHDAAIHSLAQWARRSRRSGFAYAARAWLHRRDGTKYCWRQNARIAFWAAGVPLIAVGLAIFLSPWSMLLLGIYPVQLIRIAFRVQQDRASGSAILIAFFNMLGNWMEFSGQLLFAFRQLSRTRQAIIEYK